ncbi:MAG: branched-chain amino acid transaminase [Dehalococcoidia bacterium]|nr:MAG: branched-chain amino acid transaminase [Dehalococcoidia bacterium]
MPPYAFFDGKFVPLAEAKIGIMTHAFNYGTACFEGIRGNWNEEQGQMYIFRLAEHYQRLLESCRVLQIEIPRTKDELFALTIELVQRCGYREDTYIRPMAYKSSEQVGVRLHNLEASFLLFAIPFGPYLDITKGAKCCVCSWRRIDSSMIPPRAKINGLYVNSALAKTEAVEKGFDEAILLTHDGHVSEGSGENIFLIIDGQLVTPPSSDNILIGITRDTVITLAKSELGIETIERSIAPGELYTADECFLTGTAAHVTPVTEIDHRKVGRGEVGDITKKLQALYFDVILGKSKRYLDWCTPAYKLVKA